ncbi:hypothetical protein AAV96_00320 [Acinetobacter sp. AG1]|uniref:hypothetical protein n=1 Tax=Acinetobacter TaxID=469 RepID=UPI000629B7F3|nr:hypothetical protein [Acinetobacter sp. AG1]KKW82397.1 hypothetical protein AAV96_00320 [Acinetobacter sp. AG1]
MDNWQKTEILSKVIGAVLIPVAIVYLSNQMASANKQRDSETKFVELATIILNKEPTPNQSAESKNLREWAVNVINKFSSVPMSQQTVDALIKTTSLPQITSSIASQSVSGSSSSWGAWGVVFGGDKTFDSAQYEVTKTAEKMGLGIGEIFYRSGSYRSVKIFISRAEAEDAVGKAQRIRPDSYVVNMSTWCSVSEQRVGYFECK